MCIKMVCRTDKGRVREHNEDSIGIDESLGLAVLADGMGGCQAGEVASKMAVQSIMEELSTVFKTQPSQHRHANHHYHSATVRLEQAVLKSNQFIYHKAEEKKNYQGMGTTVIAALFNNHLISIAHVGDSRLYRIRGETFCQITKDHSVRQELIDCGYYTPEQARRSHNKNLVTRALGVSKNVAVEIQEHSMLAQDIYLLCSDGLNDMIDDCEIHTIISNANTFEEAAQSLINAANEKGGKDNISLILIRPPSVKLEKSKRWWLRLFDFFKIRVTKTECNKGI